MEVFATACKATPIFMQTDTQKLTLSMVINGLFHVIYKVFKKFVAV
jgi:hypothetical protein